MIKLQNPITSSILKKWPAGNITQYYGENPVLYQTRTNGRLKFHNGIDVITKEGDEVRATHSATVLKTDYGETKYGAGVWLLGDEFFKDTDGDDCVWLTVYWHLRKDILVKIGDKVKAGDLFGYESNTGFVISGGTAFWGNAPAGKGVHLHFGCALYCKKQFYSDSYPYYVNGVAVYPKHFKNGVQGFLDPLYYIEGNTDKIKSALSFLDYLKAEFMKLLLKWKK